jgi:hypothetical protein
MKKMNRINENVMLARDHLWQQACACVCPYFVEIFDIMAKYVQLFQTTSKEKLGTIS